MNEHNGATPRDFWMEDWEKKAILDFHHSHPLEGYRRLTFMMLDANVVAVSPSSVYRVLGEAGVMDRFNGKKSKQGTGFGQPSEPHDHWHVDISYLNICGTFFFMCSVLDGCSRVVQQYVIHYKEVRLHSAIGYVAPHTKLARKEKEVFAARDEKLEAAREARRIRRQQLAA